MALRSYSGAKGERRWALLLLGTVSFFGVQWRGAALAVCDAIPGVSLTFRGTTGSTDRPFAGPGDFVELRLSPFCDAAAVCPFTSEPGFCPNANDHVVTIAFTPPSGGPRNVVLLAADCSGLEPACSQQAGGANVTCIRVNGAGDPLGMETVEISGQRRLRFRFPDTDDLVDNATDDRTLTGSATLAVTARNQALPCDLATVPCAGHGGLLACIDRLFSIDGTCGTTPQETFGHFTALPPPNNYQALCTDPAPPCTGLQNELRFTVDAAGNILAPMDWRGILPNQGVPIARLLRGSTSVEAFPGSGQPIRIPSNAFLRSFTPKGGPVAPLFDPQNDPTAASEMTLFGTADAPQGVLRIARRSPTFQTCVGGDNDGLPCTSDADCPGPPGTSCAASTCVGGGNDGVECTVDGDCPEGECGPGLFDFGTRLLDGDGPALVGGGQLQAGALDPVPLEGLRQSDQALGFVFSEAIANEELNDDSDTTDHVVTLTDRRTGITETIGSMATKGRAVTRIKQPPFSFSAVAMEGNVVAFLESEPAEGFVDANENGRVFDSILRVFELGAGEITAPISPPLVADASPLINGGSLVISNGRVFFRLPEAAAAVQTTERYSVSTLGVEGNAGSGPGAISSDGRFVAFASDASNLVAGDTNEERDIFVHDRMTGITERVSLSSTGTQANGRSSWPAISADGLVVAFQSEATNLVTEDDNSNADVFIHDRATQMTQRVSVHSNGTQGNGFSGFRPALSGDGRFVAFGSDATSLVDEDDNDKRDVFVHDRVVAITERVSVSSTESQGNNHAYAFSSMSADGRFVAFRSAASNLVVGDSNAVQDTFVRDRVNGTTERVSIASDGTQADDTSLATPTISRDGRFIAFMAFATNLVPGDTNDREDVFVHDRTTHRTERVSIASDGSQGVDVSRDPAISPDGRFIGFTSFADSFVPGDSVGDDIFLHDRLTGMTDRVSLTSAGGQADDRSLTCDVAEHGRFVQFGSLAGNLVGNDANGTADVFVRGRDAGDSSADVFADGEIDDVVLEVVAVGAGTVTPLCPAEAVAVSNGNAAFLRPESVTGTAACPGGSLNGDGDTVDLVAQLWPGAGPVQNLGLAAVAVAISDTHVAVLVPETEQGQGDLSGDGDSNDTVVHVRSLGGGPWANTQQPADEVQMCGDVAFFMTPEVEKGLTLNGDGDTTDRVLQVLVSGPSVVNVGQAAEEFVCGDGLAAFRTSEAAQGQDLNFDGDMDDDVLQLYDAAAQSVLNTQQAVTPCRLEACDPRTPYRLLANTVRFLTLEADQGNTDLNEDGDTEDVVLQIVNVPRMSQGGPDSATQTLGAAPSGICTSDGAACIDDTACGDGNCVVPPGDCVRPMAACAIGSSGAVCPAGQFCLSTSNPPRCHEIVGACRSDEDCSSPGAFCVSSDQDQNRIVDPLRGEMEGASVFVSAGRCVEDRQTACGPGCEAGEFCDGGTCYREHGTCRSDSTCPAGSACRLDLLTATDRDTDGDEILDSVDNCTQSANVLQDDTDGDGIGDACDVQVCGNGRHEDGEQCDDGNTAAGDCCSATCQLAPVGSPCSDGNACTAGDSCGSSGSCMPGPCNVGQTCGVTCGGTLLCKMTGGSCTCRL